MIFRPELVSGNPILLEMSEKTGKQYIFEHTEYYLIEAYPEEVEYTVKKLVISWDLLR